MPIIIIHMASILSINYFGFFVRSRKTIKSDIKIPLIKITTIVLVVF